MKKFILNTLYLLIPIFIFAISTEILLRNIPNDYLLKKEYLDKNASRIETLILGNSHTLYGLNPIFFNSNTFNASQINQPLSYDYKIFKKYQPRFKSLRTIILPISYGSLYGSLKDAPGESWRIKNYVIYYELPVFSMDLKYNLEVLSNTIKVNLKRIDQYYLNGNSNIYCNELGWGKNFNSANSINLEWSGKRAAKRHSIRNSFKNLDSSLIQSFFQDNVNYLNLFLEWGEKNDVDVLLITPPAYKSYTKNLDNKQLDVTVQTVKEICSKYKNCKYENLLESKSFIKEDYFDADHLSEIGAEKLSKLVNKKINNW